MTEPKPAEPAEFEIGKSLAKKILAVQKGVSNIPKRGHNDHYNYDYILAADAVEHLRKFCSQENLVVTALRVVSSEKVRDVQGKTTLQAIIQVVIDYLIADPDSGESIVVRWTGEGADVLDKGVYKAMTGCLKYFLLQFFMVGGEDMDAENPKHEPRKEEMQQPAGKATRRSAKASDSESGSTGRVASANKISYIQDLMQSEWIPGQVRAKMAAWLTDNKDRWPDDQATKIIDRLKLFNPKDATKSRAASTKQLQFLGKLVKSSAIPKNLAEKVKANLANHESQADFTISMALASAMIESCQWHVDQADKKDKAMKQDAVSADADKRAAAEMDQIQKVLDQIDQELKLRDGDDMSLAALAKWRAGSTWTIDDCQMWLKTVQGWPLKKAKS